MVGVGVLRLKYINTVIKFISAFIRVYLRFLSVSPGSDCTPLGVAGTQPWG